MQSPERLDSLEHTRPRTLQRFRAAIGATDPCNPDLVFCSAAVAGRRKCTHDIHAFFEHSQTFLRLSLLKKTLSGLEQLFAQFFHDSRQWLQSMRPMQVLHDAGSLVLILLRRNQVVQGIARIGRQLQGSREGVAGLVREDFLQELLDIARYAQSSAGVSSLEGILSIAKLPVSMVLAGLFEVGKLDSFGPGWTRGHLQSVGNFKFEQRSPCQVMRMYS